MRYAFIGLGNLGSHLAASLCREGFDVTVHDLNRQAADVESYRRDENLILPDDIDYAALPGLSNEARHKLGTHRPRTVGQAGRIDGMTPAALALLVAHLRRGNTRKPARGAV